MAKADSTQPSEDEKAKKAKKAEYLRLYREKNKERLQDSQRLYRAKNKENIRARGKAYREANKEEISVRRKKLREENKEKISSQRRERYLKNSEAVKQRVREYRLRDIAAYRTQHQKQQKKWRALNKDRVRAIYRRHMQKKRREDPLFDLKCKCRERIAHALKKSNSRKSMRTLELLGCSAAELASHIQSLFLPGMTWENRGRHGWHIDHIVPLSKFDLSDPAQQAAAFHYTNLQPLWAKDNLSKGARTLGQNLFGFAHAARIADAASAKPKRRRKHGGEHKCR